SPQVALDSQGRATVVWAKDTWVEARTYDGAAWSAITTISHAQRGGEGPRLAVDPAGGVTAVWTAYDAGAGRQVVDSA
ncbi:hypothetical protein RCK68_23885, partial [Salmonella enterica subsp. enterica serovar Typhimurium]